MLSSTTILVVVEPESMPIVASCNPGRRLADAQGGALVAVVIGYKTEAAVKVPAAYGDRCYQCGP